ncbi:MAG: SIS domain-containing protein [Candidatus Micrarchaeota archaeon]|nr:SIS domain-containing protein [Candidatus Micrarchaeota archaeon]
MQYTKQYLRESGKICKEIDTDAIEKMVGLLRRCADDKGRLFILGLGGSAANASHAVNDFRKICRIDAHTPTDNVAEFSARVNDEGLSKTFINYLRVSRLNKNDAIMIFSVNGGDSERSISPNIIEAIDYAKQRKSRIIGVVGSDRGYTAQKADVCVVIPTVSIERRTAHAEEFQAVVWHLLVNHPTLRPRQRANNIILW